MSPFHLSFARHGDQGFKLMRGPVLYLFTGLRSSEAVRVALAHGDGHRVDVDQKNERRGTPRLPFASRITVGVEDSVYECRARDLGTGGLFIYFDGDVPPVDSKLNLAFNLDDVDGGLEVTGRVVRHGSGGNGVGVAFVELNEKARARLESYIDAAVAEGSPGSTDHTS